MKLTRSSFRTATMTVAAPIAFAILTACSSDSSRVDDQLRADLAAAAQAPSMRQGYASPAELGYPQAGYPQQYGQYPQQYHPQQYGYPQPVYAPAPQRVVVQRAPAQVVYRGSSAGTVVAEQPTRRNAQKGAIIGAATGAAVGVATSKDRLKGGAIGAIAGAVLGGVIGHQVKTPRN